jgi:hypothetical protein
MANLLLINLLLSSFNNKRRFWFWRQFFFYLLLFIYIYWLTKFVIKLHYSWFHITFPWMLRTSFRTSLWSSKVHNEFTSPYVNKASNWLIFVKGRIRGFVYIRACEFQYELLNFTTKFGRSSQHSRKSYMKSTVSI